MRDYTTTANAKKFSIVEFANETELANDCQRMIDDYKAGKRAGKLGGSTFAEMYSDIIDKKYKKDWYGAGVNSFCDCLEMLQNGYKKPLAKLNASYNSNNVQHAKREQHCLRVSGYAPCVPAYVNGCPRCMHSVTTTHTERIIHLFVNIAVNCHVKADEMETASTKIAEYISGLERAGYSIELNACCFSEQRYSGGHVMGTIINLKSAGNSANVSRFTYPLCHPSFFRAFIFLQQAGNDKLGAVDCGLGRVYNDNSTLKKVLPKNSLLLNVVDIVNGASVDDCAKKWEQV